GEERASSGRCQEQSISPGAAQVARKLFPSDIYKISGNERNEQNVGVDITVCRIGYEFAQCQGERAAQADKVDTPAGTAPVHRCHGIARIDDAISPIRQLTIIYRTMIRRY